MLNSDRLVLDQNRQAMQKSSAFLTAVPHDFPGLLPRTVKAGDGTGMDQGFSGRNSLLHDINELQRRHGTCFQHGDDLMRLTRAEVLKWDDILLDLTTQMNKKQTDIKQTDISNIFSPSLENPLPIHKKESLLPLLLRPQASANSPWRRLKIGHC